MRMLNEEWLFSAEITTDDNELWVLDYLLQVFEGENGDSFGLRINKSTPSGVLYETEETLAITENRDDILIMAKAFAKGSVPPVTLLELADEWVSEVETAALAINF